MNLKIILSSKHEFIAECPPGLPLSEIIRMQGIKLKLNCGGNGNCGKCGIILESGRFKNIDTGKITETENPADALACRTECLSENAEITIPQESVSTIDPIVKADYELKVKNINPVYREIDFELSECNADSLLDELSANFAENGIKGKPEISLQAVKKIGNVSEIPNNGAKTEKMKAVLNFSKNKWILSDIKPSSKSQEKEKYALSIDIGTTTVLCSLSSLQTGKTFETLSMYNRQIEIADDVNTRISYAMHNSEKLCELCGLLVDKTINPTIEKLCDDSGINYKSIMRVSVSCNTVMAHIFACIPPDSIGVYPFKPLVRTFPDYFAEETDLKVNANAFVSIMPAISGFIGGDISSGMIVSDFMNSEDMSVLMDIGTNCEIILKSSNKFFCSAAAAGPAFEGAGIMCGSRAIEGAINHLKFSDDSFLCKTVNKKEPIGICGSAVIDFIAEAYRNGLINQLGRYNIEKLQKLNLYHQIEYNGRKINSCIIVPAEKKSSNMEIFISESDIEQLLKAKAAVYAGLQTLVSYSGNKLENLNKLYFAGAFAQYINLENIVEIGMLPENIYEKTEILGNSSLKGAYQAVYDIETNMKAEKMIDIPEFVPLNTIPEFQNNFIDALMIPAEI